MELSISNIAWDSSEDTKIRSLLNELQINFIEVAPTKITASPLTCTVQELNAYNEFWNSKGISIVSLQSLLFGRPDLLLFGTEEVREELYRYIIKILDLGVKLGAKSFVFGSPKNRLKNALHIKQAYEIAVPFFSSLGGYAESLGARICIEPNPPQYGCDFIRNTQEGIEFIEAIGSPGVRLHLDAAALFLNGEDIKRSIAAASPYLSHFHISEPYLEEVKAGCVDHRKINSMLKEINYNGFISIEMKEGLSESNVETVRRSLEFVKDIYLG